MDIKPLSEVAREVNNKNGFANINKFLISVKPFVLSKIELTHTELAELTEAVRKYKKDPEKWLANAGEEIAGTCIRIFDAAGWAKEFFMFLDMLYGASLITESVSFDRPENFLGRVGHLRSYLDDAKKYYVLGDIAMYLLLHAKLLIELESICVDIGLNLFEEVKTEILKNSKREYKHDGKAI